MHTAVGLSRGESRRPRGFSGVQGSSEKRAQNNINTKRGTTPWQNSTAGATFFASRAPPQNIYGTHRNNATQRLQKGRDTTMGGTFGKGSTPVPVYEVLGASLMCVSRKRDRL